MRTDNAPSSKEIVERDAIWSVDPVTDVPLLRACTLDRAIDKLILESLAPDQQQFLSAFVLTYRFFTVPEKFFELITKRYGPPRSTVRQDLTLSAALICLLIHRWMRRVSSASSRLLACVFVLYCVTGWQIAFSTLTTSSSRR